MKRTGDRRRKHIRNPSSTRCVVQRCAPEHIDGVHSCEGLVIQEQLANLRCRSPASFVEGV